MAGPQGGGVSGKRGVVKTIALVIGLLIIILGALGAIGGEILGGVIIMIVGALPALYGFRKPKGVPAEKTPGAGELHAQTIAHVSEIELDSDPGDIDFDFD